MLDDSAEEYHQKAYEAQQKGNLEQALTYYSKALSLGLEDSKVYNDIGILYEQLGAPARAQDYYREAIQIDPNYLPAYTNLGYLYLEQGNTEKASEFFRLRLAKSPGNDPWRTKIQEELFEIDPKYKQEAVAQQTKKLKEELLAKAHEKFNLQIIRSEKHYQQGRGHFNEGKFKEAILDFDRALLLTPNNPKILRGREQAVFESHVDDVRKRTNSAIEKLENKDVDSARKQFEDILTQFPDE